MDTSLRKQEAKTKIDPAQRFSRQLCLKIILGFFALVTSRLPVTALVGVSAPAPEFAPYVVMVLTRMGAASGYCSASVVAQNMILTAAHCVADAANTRIHYHGEHDEPVLAEVVEIVRHPEYHADAVQTRQRSIDLALVRLAQPLPARFKPVALAPASEIKVGQAFRIAGFGVTDENAPDISGHLRSARIAARAPLSKILLWANDPLSRGTGACTGDSGGPVFAQDRPELVAVMDWAEGAGSKKCGALTQAALIAPQRPWIEGVMASWGDQR